MSDLVHIINSYENLKKQNTPSVLATVVQVQGSSYRRPGARMLVDYQGYMYGMISGGCLEGDAKRKALLALDQFQNKLITYDTSDEEDAIVGAQLGCQGIIQVQFEPLDYQSDNNPMELLKYALNLDANCCLIHLYSGNRQKAQVGTCMVIDSNLIPKKSINLSIAKEQFLKPAQCAIENANHQFLDLHILQDRLSVFVEFLWPPLSLIIVGAGNDAQLLARQAEILNWRVTIIDGRMTHANEQRFQSACQIIVDKPELALANYSFSDRSAVILMTHNYNYDLAVLKSVIQAPNLNYIGILGPKKKFNLLIDEMINSGINANKFKSKLFGPIGLDIGSETPAEIGLSILAEIQTVFNRKKQIHLRDREGRIHVHSNHGIESNL